jgi:hypothetical protein
MILCVSLVERYEGSAACCFSEIKLIQEFAFLLLWASDHISQVGAALLQFCHR